MNGKRICFLALLLCFAVVFSTASAQELTKVETGGRKAIRVVQEGFPAEVDVDPWLSGGEFVLSDPSDYNPPRVIPGPAPEPYPHVHVWEQGIEQLGQSDVECDGIYFRNGSVWTPNKKIFVIWTIRIPNASMRDPSEFEQDINVALWVDWNSSGDWEQNEDMIRADLNVQEYFPTIQGYVEIEFLTYFRVPEISAFAADGGGAESFKKKIWTRGVLSYCDSDASPNGESVFGEVEDYQVCYFENAPTKDKISK